MYVCINVVNIYMLYIYICCILYICCVILVPKILLVRELYQIWTTLLLLIVVCSDGITAVLVLVDQGAAVVLSSYWKEGGVGD